MALSKKGRALVRTPTPLAIFPLMTSMCFAQFNFSSRYTPRNFVYGACAMGALAIYRVFVKFTAFCRELGFAGGRARVWSEYGQGADSQPIMLDNLHCSGDEASISACEHHPWREHNCGHEEDVAIGNWRRQNIDEILNVNFINILV